MELVAGLSVAFLVLVALAISLKTFALWLRSRGLPELLLSGMLASATVIGYPLAIAGMQLPPSEGWPLQLGSQVAFSVGYACLLLFTLKVFRPKAVWAVCLAALTLLGFVVATCAYGFEATGENPRPVTELVGLTLLTSAPVAIAYFWAALESLLYHRQLRLRLRLGLADVVVANRVLLWGLMSLAAGSAVILNAGAVLTGYFMTPPIVLASSVLGLVHASFLFLAFHPPAWYTVWLERRSAGEGA